MTDRPASLELLDLQLAASVIAHEAVADLYQDLVERDAGDYHARALLRESSVLALERIPELARPLRGLEREWEEQELLDPPAAERTAECLAGRIAELLPAFTELRARQSEIVSELLDLVDRVS